MQCLLASQEIAGLVPAAEVTRGGFWMRGTRRKYRLDNGGRVRPDILSIGVRLRLRWAKNPPGPSSTVPNCKRLKVKL
jgi:hypothetical protein